MTRAERLRRIVPPLYPIAFPVAYVLNFWSGTGVDPRGLARSLVAAVVVAIIASGLATAIAGRTRGGLAASAVLVALIAPPSSPAVLALLAVAVVVLGDGVIRRRRTPERAALIDRVMLTLASVALIAVSISIVANGSLGRAIGDIERDAAPRGPVEARSGELAPDIVMVLLDGFPGDTAATLAAEAGSPYDADAFPAALTGLGFHVQRDSRSNYLLTAMTLASTFEMRHLVDDPAFPVDSADPDDAGDRPFRRVLNDSAALDALHRAGYELVWVDGGFNTIEVRRVDRWIERGPSEAEIRLLELTFAGRLLTMVAPDLPSALERDRVRAALDDITRLIDEPHEQPRFVFVHVPSPHAPWVFGPNGEPRTEPLGTFYSDPAAPREMDRAVALRHMFDQSTFIADEVSRRLARLVDRPDPPAVVVFSDHGPGTGLSFPAPLTSDLAERSSNFLATFTPGQPDLFAAFTTPVNLFPTLLDGYLGLDVPRSPDTLYAWSGRTTNPVEVESPSAAPP